MSLMDDVEAIYSILKILRERRDTLKDTISHGVQTWEDYKFLTGQVAAFNFMEQEIQDLQKNDERTDNTKS